MTFPTPPQSGTATPTTSSLTTAAISKASASTSAMDPSTAPPASAPAPLKASLLTTTRTDNPLQVPPPDSPLVATSSITTDHMITCHWDSTSGWSAPLLAPTAPLTLAPTAQVLHYATECFEGMKLYRSDHDGRLRLFRPHRNCERMARSAARVALPGFAPTELEKLILAICALDGPRWLPRHPPSSSSSSPSAPAAGRFLYVRPTLIATEASLGVQQPKEALLFIILTLFPDLSDPTAHGPPRPGDEGGGVPGLRLLASREDTIRAWPGGFGAAKLGANYGPALVAQAEARDRGFHQVLWLLGPDAAVTEAGASNFFVVWRTKPSSGSDSEGSSGGGGETTTELVTAGLEDGVILEGVTRASLLQLARERLAGELRVSERRYTMADVRDAALEGRLVEAFAAGTAYFVAPVSLIEWKGERLDVPLAEGKTGRYSRLLRAWLGDIMFGREEHEWAVVVPEHS